MTGLQGQSDFHSNQTYQTPITRSLHTPGFGCVGLWPRELYKASVTNLLHTRWLMVPRVLQSSGLYAHTHHHRHSFISRCCLQTSLINMHRPRGSVQSSCWWKQEAACLHTHDLCWCRPSNTKTLWYSPVSEEMLSLILLIITDYADNPVDNPR